MVEVRRRKTQLIITGVKQLDRRLVGLKLGMANQIARAALSAGARQGVKMVKAQLTGKKRKLRKAIGWSVKKSRTKGGVVEAKFGAAVGKKKSKQQAEFSEAIQKRGGKGGVGISSANIHWYIQGTSSRKTAKGWRRGKMPADQIVKRAMASGKGLIIAAMRIAGEKKLEQLRLKLLATK